MCEKESFMREAIKLSLDNIDHDGGPFGAVIVKDGKIIARGGKSCDGVGRSYGACRSKCDS